MSSSYLHYMVMIILLITKYCLCKNYRNYTLYRVIPENYNELTFMSILNTYYDVNYWREPSLIGMPIEFVINPSHKSEFLKTFQDYEIPVQTLIEDVQSAFDQQTVEQYVRRQMSSMTWNNYYKLEDIYSWINDLSLAYPRQVRLIVIGNTYENRQILAVNIALNDNPDKSTVIIEGGIHAREWISPAIVTYLINSILNAKYFNAKWKRIAHHYNWYIVPVLNPDGYAYTHSHDRLWRKNRNGAGVDINRNFGIAFGTKDASMMPSAETYCGPHPFSEKESSAISKLVKFTGRKLDYYLAFHSYGQYMILPYGHLMQHMDNYREVFAICQEASRSIASRYQTNYKVGTVYETVGYQASGISGCWVKKNFNVPYVITFELRDQGAEGFALSPNWILPTCEETLDGLIAILKPKMTKARNRTRDLYGHYSYPKHSGEPHVVLEKVIFVFNVFLFIIVRFE